MHESGRSRRFNYEIGNAPEASMASTAIASADEANGWLKPEKTVAKEGKRRKEAKGRGRDSR